jgi:hypothetical protein
LERFLLTINSINCCKSLKLQMEGRFYRAPEPKPHRPRAKNGCLGSKGEGIVPLNRTAHGDSEGNTRYYSYLSQWHENGPGLVGLTGLSRFTRVYHLRTRRMISTPRWGVLWGFASQQKWLIGKTVSEVGSGLNGRRPKLTTDMTVGAIVVEHRERLMRFGFEYVEAARARARSKTDCD